MSRYGWKAKHRAIHVAQRLAERYNLEVSRADIDDIEAAVNTLERKDFFPSGQQHTDRCLFYYQDKLILAVVSRPAYRGNPRHILTVLPND